MNKLILGSTGFLGSEFSGTPFPREGIFSKNCLKKFIKDVDVVFNCVGSKDREGKIDELEGINVEAVKVIAEVCKELNVKLVHFSTIYSGDYDNYTRTKRESEKIVLKGEKNLVVRLPVLFSKKKQCFLKDIIDGLKYNTVIHAYKNESICPIFVEELKDFDFSGNGIVDLLGEFITRERLISYVSNYLEKQPIVKYKIRPPQPITVTNGVTIYTLMDRIVECLDRVNLHHN